MRKLRIHAVSYAFYSKMRKKMRKMMRKIASVRKMMRKIVFMRKMMGVKTSSFKGNQHG